MPNAFHYYSRFQSARGGLGQLPSWARSVVLFFALPGIALLLLSILCLFVSILALLLLTVPVYRALQAVLGVRPVANEASVVQNPFVSSMFGFPSQDGPAGRKHVEATVVDSVTDSPEVNGPA
jgi:hypothetical protein